MHISKLAVFFLFKCALAAYQNPTNMLLAAPMLQRNYIYKLDKSTRLTAQSVNRMDASDEAMLHKLQELKILEASVKETELRQKEIEDAINKIDSELFSLHQEAVEVSIKKKSISNAEAETKVRPSQLQISTLSVNDVSQAYKGKSNSSSSWDLTKMLGATVSGFVVTAGFRSILMSRDEKKMEDINWSETKSSTSTLRSHLNSIVSPKKVGNVLKGIEDVEAEALFALKLATEALEKNNVKVVKLDTQASKHSINLKKNWMWEILSRIFFSNDYKNDLDSKTKRIISASVSPSGMSAANMNKEESHGIVLKNEKQGGNFLKFDTAPAFGEIVNDYLFTMAKREFERETQNLVVKVKNDDTDPIGNHMGIRKVIEMISISSLSGPGGVSSKTQYAHGIELDGDGTIDVEVTSKTDIKFPNSLSSKDSPSIPGVMVFDTRLPFDVNFLDGMCQQTISSVTEKILDSPVDEDNIAQISQQIEKELSKHEATHVTNSVEEIISDLSSDSNFMTPGDLVDAEHPESVPREIVTRLSSEALPVANERQNHLVLESSNFDEITSSVDHDFLYPSEIIASYQSEKLNLDILTTGNLFGRPSRSAKRQKFLVSTIRDSKDGIGGKMKLNVLQFFRLRRKLRGKHRSLFVTSDEKALISQKKSLLSSLIIFSKLFENALKENKLQ